MARSKRIWSMPATLCGLLLLASCEDASTDVAVSGGPGSPNLSAAESESPAAKLGNKEEGSWINISGTVVATLPSAFQLDYGRSTVRVEMDDWDWNQEGQLLKPGDRVAVTGRVDEDLHTKKSIEARSVFVERLGTYFHASAADEESLRNSNLYRGRAPGHVDAIGRVIAVEGRELTLGPIAGPLRVDTSRMGENPLDDKGFQRIRIGDRIYVWGTLARGGGERPNFKAKGITILAADKRGAA